jgi:hypothetical protein
MAFSDYTSQPKTNFDSDFVINKYVNIPSNYKLSGCNSATAELTVDETDDLVNSTQFKIVDTDGDSHTFTIVTGNDVVTNNNVGVGYAISEEDCAEAASQVMLAIIDPTSTTYGKINANNNASCTVTMTQLLGPCSEGNQSNNVFTCSGQGITLGNFSGGDNLTQVTAVPFSLGQKGPGTLRSRLGAYCITKGGDPSTIIKASSA